MYRWLLIATALIAFNTITDAQNILISTAPTITETGDGGCDGGCPLPPEDGDESIAATLTETGDGGCDGGCPLPPEDDESNEAALYSHGCGDDDCDGDGDNDGDKSALVSHGCGDDDCDGDGGNSGDDK